MPRNNISKDLLSKRSQGAYLSKLPKSLVMLWTKKKKIMLEIISKIKLTQQRTVKIWRMSQS